ncbi:MAG: response regulator [Candidatus Portnoybacteria bacterium CG06_land_8_20_14_3_00_39_12]|uniref:Response regulator n=1 Tax=Candidatus Portnoybacteria bacterium CG06_land_8_20_14_3_00_39_12 TaxID=1974809 RepID=A0A2M7AY26_9BACT|nr:MAG: hypothetical protein AUJ33_00980 [Parcubacteria group bacterium CG1_02_40_25]PIU75541.1 MAG: response regulator [Candidatus Portnoybacteria bacterium CG06_land_8_20_14_3_00_39_12]
MPEKLTKILIVEDDHYMRKIYSNKLRRAGFEVIEAIQGEEGWHKILYEQPDLIILDLILPMKSGFQLLSDIKGNDKTKKIPVIILTNLSQGSDIQKGKDLGADDYLVKTDISLTEVVDKVKMVLAKQR